MNFINLQGKLINLAQAILIYQNGNYIRMKFDSGKYEEWFYNSIDDAKVAFSQIKMDIDRMQKHDVSTKG